MRRLRTFVQLLFTSLLYWIVAFLVFIAIRYNGLEQEMSIYTDDVLFLPIAAYYEYAILLGLVIGVFYAIIEFLFDVFFSKKLALGLSIVLKSLIYFVLIILGLSSVSFLIEQQIDIDLPNDEVGWWHTDPFFWNTVIYFIIASIIFSFIRIANDKFGSGTFLNMLLGKYQKPKEEERILMFLDLKDSTKIAEQIGHEAYSSFIQDCFMDLNSVLRNHEAEIYQYVGDEAVISWPNRKGFRDNNCVQLFFSFEDQLKKRSNYYKQTYKQEPVFKAGVHCGKLMIAEVGSVKKELAYHGDVINTASRIQSLCNGLNSSLLVSETLLNKSFITLRLKAKLIENISLRGKEEELNIYDITRN